uniref:Uncharacterized protein n=1 Tax=Anopheles coluzzii TaxID=1518534 RepID=A0A8W7PJ89_ANOCL
MTKWPPYPFGTHLGIEQTALETVLPLAATRALPAGVRRFLAQPGPLDAHQRRAVHDGCPHNHKCQANRLAGVIVIVYQCQHGNHRPPDESDSSPQRCVREMD